METQTLSQAKRRTGILYALGSLYFVMAAVWVVFGVMMPYFGHGFGGDWAHRWSLSLPDLGATLGRALCIGVHFVCGSVITLLGLWQVAPMSRRPNLLKWHRRSGRFYVVCSIVTAVGGIGFIAQEGKLVGGYSMTVAFLVYGLLVLGCALKAWQTVRAGDIDAHRRWALRSFSLGIASFMYRGYSDLAYFLGFFGDTGPDDTSIYKTPFMKIDEWWFFLPNLLVVEWYVRVKDERPQRVLFDLLLVVLALFTVGLPVLMVAAVINDTETHQSA